MKERHLTDEELLELKLKMLKLIDKEKNQSLSDMMLKE